MNNTNDTIILEIAVDRLNEKGVFVAREMLATLHDTLAHTPKKWGIFTRSPIFRFSVVHVGARIRFFMETERMHRDFLESQLYAHYSDIEITEVALPFPSDTTFTVSEVMLAHISADPIKLYVNLQDRTEKETIDPLSSITSVLQKSTKSEIAFVRVDFAPIADSAWRE